MAELVDSQPAAPPFAAATPNCRPFTARLWLLWIGAAALNEALLDGVLSLLEADHTGLAVLLLLLLAPTAVTLEWQVLRRAFPGLAWGAWLFANAASGATTFTSWVAVMLSASPDTVMTLGGGITTLLMRAVGSTALAWALSYAVGRYPWAFLISSIAAGFVVPLDVAIEHGPICVALINATSDISPVANWLDGPGFRFLPFRPVILLPDAHMIFLLTQALGRIAANALGAAVTGFGLWWLCRAPPGGIRRLHQIGK
jgi:hypothetical protein